MRALVVLLMMIGVLVGAVWAFTANAYRPNNFWPLGSSDLAAWVQAVGSVAAILVAVWISHQDSQNAEKRARAAERSEAESVLRIIAAELFVQWTQYESSAGSVVLNAQDKKPMLFYWEPPNTPLPVQMACIGRLIGIEDTDLHRKIVLAYAEFTLLIRLFRLNNRELENIDQANRLAIQLTKGASALQDESLRRLAGNTTSLKNAHSRADKFVREALGAIAHYLNRGESKLQAPSRSLSSAQDESA